TLGRPEERGADLDALLAAVGRLWTAGVEVDWERFHGEKRRRRVGLPTYPFERQRYWIDPPSPSERAVPATAAADLADWFWVPSWTRVPLASAPGQKRTNGRGERWLVFADREGLGERIAAQLRAEGREVATVVVGADFKELGKGTFAIDPGRRVDYDAL